MPPQRRFPGRLIRFAIVGGSLTVLSYVIFMSGVALGLHYLVVSTVAWMVGVTISYFVNKSYTFEKDSTFVFKEFLIFVSGYVIQLVLTSIGYILLIDGLNFSPTPAFLVNLSVVSLLSFLYMQFAVFYGERRDG